MNQFVITEGGLKLAELNLNLTNTDQQSDSVEPDETTNILSDLEKSYYLQCRVEKDFKGYVSFLEILTKVIRGSFTDVADILETQITNHDLNHTGWSFLLKLVTYLYEDSQFDYVNNKDCRHLKEMRIKLGSILDYPTFKNDVRSEDQNSDTKHQTESLRSKEYNVFLDESGLRSHKADIVDCFLTPLYRDLPLTYRTVGKLFFNDK